MLPRATPLSFKRKLRCLRKMPWDDRAVDGNTRNRRTTGLSELFPGALGVMLLGGSRSVTTYFRCEVISTREYCLDRIGQYSGLAIETVAVLVRSGKVNDRPTGRVIDLPRVAFDMAMTLH